MSAAAVVMWFFVTVGPMGDAAVHKFDTEKQCKSARAIIARLSLDIMLEKRPGRAPEASDCEKVEG